MSICRHTHGIQCIIAPHMAETIKQRGDAKQKKMIDELMSHSVTFRTERESMSSSTSFQAAHAISSDVTVYPKRKVYDGGNGHQLPGKLVRGEGDDPTQDDTVNEAYDGAGDTFNLYFDHYQRDSLDGNGMTMKSTVHHRSNYNNAFWNGQQMAYGDGDDILFKSFTKSLSVIGHELSHGVVQFSGGLRYRDQSGALNESFADIFGVLVVQNKLRQEAYEASWLVGDGILGPNINGDALRSLKAPGTAYSDDLLGTDPQPYHMDDFIITSADNGGVHMNSGIPNHAFYLLANYLRGYAWEKAGKIWYDTMQEINNPHITFAKWADKTVEVARRLFGSGSREAMFTRRAWKLVGIST